MGKGGMGKGGMGKGGCIWRCSRWSDAAVLYKPGKFHTCTSSSCFTLRLVLIPLLFTPYM
jgi:hypothetical protein